MQVNIHDAAFIKVSLAGDSKSYRDWRPWTAQSYVPVRTWGAWTKGLAIALIVLIVLTFLVLVAIVIKQNCMNRGRRFGRLDEGQKAKRSPSGRLSSSDRVLDSVT